MPPDEKVNSPFLARACSITSATVLAGFDGMHDQHVGDREVDRQQDQVLVRIVARALVEAHVVDQQPLRHDAERVAVRRRARELGHGDGAAGSGLVVDHHALAERLAELLAVQAAADVAGGAGRVGHDQADRTGRPLLRMCAASGRASEAARSVRLFIGPPKLATSCASCCRRRVTSGPAPRLPRRFFIS